MSGAIKAFGAMLDGQGNICVQVGKALALRCKVPYHEDRVGGGKLLGYKRRVEQRSPGSFSRGPGSGGELEGPLLDTQEFQMPDGEILRTNEWPKRLHEERAIQLTGEVWEQDPYWPDSFHDVKGAVQKCCHGITGIYWHGPSMNLVLVSASGAKVGIRSTALVIPLIGLRQDEARLLGTLKKAATS